MGNVLQFRERTRALIVVQSHFRRYLAETEFNEYQMNKRKRAQEVKKKVAAQTIRDAVKVYINRKKAIKRIQAVARRYLARVEFKQLLKRTRIAKEIVQTEETYVSSLNTMVKLSEELENKRVISSEDVKNIFCHVQVISLYNYSLLKDLQKELATWSYESCIGKTFVTMTDFLKVYIQYVNNFDTSLKTINKCLRSDTFVNFLKKQKVSDLLLESLVIQPIQRIPRYVLLLQNLVENTPTRHPDFVHVAYSLTKIKDIAELINYRKREFDNYSELLMINQQIDPPMKDLVWPRRLILHRGELFLMVTERNSVVEYYYFLFSDLFVLTFKDREDKYLFKMTLPLLNAAIIVHELDNMVIYTTGSGAEKKKYQFKFKSPEDTKAFVAAMNEAIFTANSSVETSFYKDKGAMLKVADFNRQLKPQCVDSVQELIVVDDQVWAGLGNGDICVWDRKNFTKLKDFKTRADRIYVLLNVGDTVWCSSGTDFIEVFNKKTNALVATLDAEKAVIKSMLLVKNRTSLSSLEALFDDMMVQPRNSKKKNNTPNNSNRTTKRTIYGDNPFSLLAQKPDTPLFSSIKEKSSHDVWTATCLEGLVLVWDTEQFKIKGRIHVDQGISAMAQYNNFVWLCSVDGWIYVFHIETLEVTAKWRAHNGIINSILVAEQDQLVWTCSNDCTIAVWDPQTLKEKRRLECPGKCLSMIEIKGHGHVWSGIWTKEIVVWDAKKLCFITEMKERHKDGVRALVQTRENEVWSGGRELDCNIVVWDYLTTPVSPPQSSGGLATQASQAMLNSVRATFDKK